MQIKLDLPEIEGFEPAEGEQPRVPKEGECFARLEGTFCICGHSEMSDKYIILKKKAPKYKVVNCKEMITITNKPLNLDDTFAEIKAVEDAMQLVNLLLYQAQKNSDDYNNYSELMELIK